MPNAAPHSPDDTYDQWLVLQAQAGDEQAMRRLYTRWAKRLQRHAMRLTGDVDAAADASQEAWLAIVRGLRKLNDPACFRRWAYQIVGHKCADWVRRRQRSRATTEPMTGDPEAPSTTDHSEDRCGDIRRTLRGLPNQDRVLLALYYADDMPLAEVAEALALPLGTVKSRLHHARQRLRDALRRDARNQDRKE